MVAEANWKARFRAPTISMPTWARDAPDKCMYVSNSSGTYELYTWDRATDTHVQATKRPSGTVQGALSPDGEQMWWFDDTKGDEKGVWRRQPFGAAAGDAASATTLDAGYPVGLAIAVDGTVAAGLAADGWHRLFLVEPDGRAREVHALQDALGVGGFSHDGTLLAYSHGQHGDNRNRALRVITRQGETVADLWDGEGKGLGSFRWAPLDGDQRVLIVHERRGHRHPAVWSPTANTVTDLDIELEGELLLVDWYPEAAAVLVLTMSRGRTRLHRHDLVTGRTTALDQESGMVVGARVRPDGELWWAGTSAAEPPSVHCGDTILRPPGEVAPGGVSYEDVFADGEGGSIHAFLARPVGEPPYPTIFHVHGGPSGVDTDSFNATVQAWVDHGFAVVMVNYRGSMGYGKEWLDAIVGKPGYRELEDLASVRAKLVADGICDTDKVVLEGGSWGGYLTLLGVGTQPDLWSLGISAVPLASLRNHYHEQGEVLQAYWRSLFGGTPESIGNALDDIDPIADVDRIEVPVYILVGDNDPRCPLQQVLTYVAALEKAGVDHELYRYDAGHGSMVIEEQLEQLHRRLDFAARRLGTTKPIDS